MSSDHQRALSEYVRDEEDDQQTAQDAEQPAWSPGTASGTKNHCDACGGHVTPQFRRIYEDEDGDLHGCTNCMTGAEIRNGLATDPDRDLSHEYEAGAYAHAVNGGGL